jgi:hypothetical protein
LIGCVAGVGSSSAGVDHESAIAGGVIGIGGVVGIDAAASFAS